MRFYLLHTPMEAEDELHDISHRKEPKQSRAAGSQASLRSLRGSFSSITSIPSGFLQRFRHGSLKSVTWLLTQTCHISDMTTTLTHISSASHTYSICVYLYIICVYFVYSPVEYSDTIAMWHRKMQLVWGNHFSVIFCGVDQLMLSYRTYYLISCTYLINCFNICTAIYTLINLATCTVVVFMIDSDNV